MNVLQRGLYALILTLYFQNTLVAEYLYKDEVIFNPKFNESVEELGSELYEKTGISLRLLMLKELPEGMKIAEYEKEVMKNFSTPTILLTFSEMDAKVDILAYPTSLYEYFDKKQILSPISSPIQAFVIALLSMDFSDMSSGGTILPLLAEKSKKGEVLGKYSGAMFNGYADIAEQVADSKGIELEHAIGSANQIAILVIKTLFYGIILIVIFIYIKRKIYSKWQDKNE
ncbi:3-dehydroquinate dehydratase [Sulfurimonas sp.]|uniref:3-dehydroquinate dehydratase n=1 Tax=Sulfurimonas sp. TaxID=2022749 RepID=UPI00356713B0